MSSRDKYRVLDLFCGCGGLSYGFEKAGYAIKYGIDNWESALKTYTYNHKSTKVINEDLSELNVKKIISDYNIKNIDVIIGGPPCQGFSIAGKRLINDERNLLYKSFIGFVKEIRPKMFLMENVPNILSMGKGVVKENIMNDFNEIDYYVNCEILMASNYGVPQNRKRAFFIGFKKQLNLSFSDFDSTSIINVSDSISDLPDIDIPDGYNYTIAPMSEYQEKMRLNSNGIFNHQLTNHSEKTVHIISKVPDGGNYKDLPKELQDTRKVNIAWTRLNSKKPSFTIDTGHRHHFHYKYNRVPTVREAARIQSFPDKFIFLGSKTSQYKQVGNAVPPLLSEFLANYLKKHL